MSLSNIDKRRLRLAVISTFVGVPLIIADLLPTGASAGSVQVTTVAEDPDSAAELASPPEADDTAPALYMDPDWVPMASSRFSESLATRSLTEAQVLAAVPPPPTTTSTTVAPTTTTTVRPTTTTAPPTTTTAPPPPPPPPPVNVQAGEASHYTWRAGNCAHRVLPFGTVVRVTNVATGASATCTVGDRGPFNSRIIDLDSTVFSQLAPLSAGVIDVVISW